MKRTCLCVPGKWADRANGMTWEHCAPKLSPEDRTLSGTSKERRSPWKCKHETASCESLKHRPCSVARGSKWMRLQITKWGEEGPWSWSLGFQCCVQSHCSSLPCALLFILWKRTAWTTKCISKGGQSVVGIETSFISVQRPALNKSGKSGMILTGWNSD